MTFFIRNIGPFAKKSPGSINQHKEFMKTPFEYTTSSNTSAKYDLMGKEVSYRFSLTALAHINPNIYESRSLRQDEKLLHSAPLLEMAALAATGSKISLSEGYEAYSVQPSDSSTDPSFNYRLNHSTLRLK